MGYHGNALMLYRRLTPDKNIDAPSYDKRGSSPEGRRNVPMASLVGL